MVSAAPLHRNQAWRPFAIAAVLFGAAAIGFVAWVALRIGGAAVTTAVDDIGEAVAAGIAAVACGLAARRTQGRLRRAWTLVAISAGAWCAGEIVWSIYEVGLGVAVPFPSAADAGFLVSIPFAIAGMLTFPNTSRGTSTGLRLWLDRSIVALSLLFVGWNAGLAIVVQSRVPPLEKALELAYPLGDILIGTVLILAIRRATDRTHGRLLMLLGGLAANSLADSAFAYLTANGTFQSGSVLDAGWVIGYLMVALAAMWPSEVSDSTAEEQPIDVWQLVLPWLAVLVAAVTAGIGALQGHALDTFSIALIGVIGVLLVASQVFAHNESLRLLIESRRLATTLNDVIVHAPLGVVRIAPDLTIIQANPSVGALLRAPAGSLTGAGIDRFLSADEMARVSERLASVKVPGDATDLELQATRADGAAVWIHLTATAVHKRDGRVDYYLAMVEDVSARHAAEEVAEANLQVLERLNKVKSQFLTKVSHEFRTALVGIQGFSEFIRESDTFEADDVKAFAIDIYEDARRLDASLNEMLELDQVETKRTELRSGPVDLDRLISDAVSSMQLGTTAHAIETEIGELPAVAADAEMLSQVVTSLLARAIHYSPPGAPVVLAARRDGELFVQVTVTDRGSAATSDLEAQLLGRVPDVERAQVRALSSNIGLPIAREIVQRHGGRLWFDTTKGVSWHFTVPVAAAGAEAELTPSSAGAS